MTRESRFLALFVSNQRSIGKFDPATGRMHTEYSACTEQDVNLHLQGKKGIGLVPILDDDTAKWAAIDIDNHGQEEDIPIAPIDEAILANKLPLIPCRSKSGGVHCYAFFKEPKSAARVRAMMANWAKIIGYPNAEIFPKQSRLMGSLGKKQLGNWINMPYLGMDETTRYAFRAGKRLSFDKFLDLAEKSLIEDTEIASTVMADHPQAPPCIQRMMMKGVTSGYRNEALYNAVVYFKKSNPDNYEALATEFNAIVFDKPLGKSELNRTIASAAKLDYTYRCNEEPIKSLCDRTTCLKRKFGITSADIERSEQINGLPVFSDVVKIMADPVRWELKIDGIPVRGLSTAQLLDWRCLREAIAERLTKVVPMIKNQEWERMLQPLMAEARVIAAPDDASTSGIIRQRLCEFAAKAKDLGENKNVDDRKALLRGLPIIGKIDGEKSVIFRAQDFVAFLKRTKTEELKGVALWMAVRDLGVGHNKMRVGERSINVWYLPYKEVDDGQLDKPEIKAEL